MVPRYDRLTKVHFTDTPVDHGKLQRGTQEEEERQEPVLSELLFPGDQR